MHVIYSYHIDEISKKFVPIYDLYFHRVVGGLLSSFDLSGDKIFLEKATDIANRLLPAWDTTSGIPFNIINLAHGNAHNPSWTGVSPKIMNINLSLLGIEYGALVLEFFHQFKFGFRILLIM